MRNSSVSKIHVSWISGMPRSGTTWLSQIFASSPDVRLKFCPLFSYEFKNALDEKSSATDWEMFFREVYQTKSEYLDQDYLRKQGLVPEFSMRNINPDHLVIKSNRFHNLTPHILQLNEQIRFVYIVRNPCASLCSWLTSPYEFPEDADPLEEWRTGSCRKNGPGEFWGFDDWKYVTRQALKYENQYPDRFRIVRYEELVIDTKKITKNLFEFIGIDYHKQTDEFIDLSQSKHDDNRRSVFKRPENKIDWKKKIDSSIISACLEEVTGTELEKFL